MKVAHIVPTENLFQTAPGGYHMALAPRLASDSGYREFYKKLHEEGHFIIVDNGAAEEAALDFEEVLTLAEYIGADEICLPDVLYNHKETFELAKEWREKVPRCKQLMIPQGEDFEDYVACAIEMLGLGPATLGINRAPLKFGRTRGEVLSRLYNLGWRGQVNFHALGVWEQVYVEVFDLRFQVRGLDTGVAAAYAQAGRPLEYLLPEHLSIDHEKRCSVNLLWKNLKTLKEWANGATNT